MKHSDLQQFVNSINLMTDVSGELIRHLRHTNIVPQIKTDTSPVTSVDKEVESSIRDIIAKLHPDHGICGEEFADTATNSEFVWVIDPIDGTLAFLAGFPVFGTLIALLHNQKPILGVIDMPVTSQRWIGGIDRPTTCNNQPVRVRNCNDINQAMLSTSNPDFYDDQTLPALLALKDCSQLNIYGGSCMAYAQLASGKIDLAIDVQSDIHDFLPLVPVIKGAGGMITDWHGYELDKNSTDKFIASGDPRVHEQALKILQSFI
ncbi:MAG: hypothetical protein OFPII_25490 [Osedax symbiont Rs1]|nr:MAG: hypothetical protein OFPII_25490 [Osedax symbiont Rs1]